MHIFNFSIKIKSIISKTFKKPVRNFSLLKNLFANKYGLEVGGPIQEQ